MTRFIRKPDGSGRLAGSVGSGRDAVPAAAAAHAPTGARPTSPGPGLAGVLLALHRTPGEPGRPQGEQSAFRTACHTCSATVVISTAQATALAAGFLHDCPRCADPARAGAYGMWPCRDCDEPSAAGCTCPGGPQYCVADGCENPRGSLEDDGSCDFCPGTADEVVDWPGGTQHVCTSCRDTADEDEVGTCDHCDATYDIGSRADHCGDCGTCWDHCDCGASEDPEDADILCDACGAYLGHGNPDAAWACRACLAAAQAADVGDIAAVLAFTDDQRHALRVHLQDSLDDDPDAEPQVTADRRALLDALGDPTGSWPWDSRQP
jgi:hypothetical protein